MAKPSLRLLPLNINIPDGAMAIPLTHGRYAIVDKDNYNWLTQWNWHAHCVDTPYPYARGIVNGKSVRMHRFILGCVRGEYVDHINRNTLDNRRGNIRICTPTENRWNSKGCGSISGYKGVGWHPQNKKWQALINKNGKRVYLGAFNTKECAAAAYNKAAIELYGEFAFLNDITPDK